MNYNDLFSRAWALIRRNRTLWALGFLAALPGGILSTIHIGPAISLTGDAGLLRGNAFDFAGWERALRLLGGQLVAAAIVTAVIAAGLLAIVLCARAGVIAASRALLREETLDLASALNQGARQLGTVLPATLILYVPYLVVSELVGEALRWMPGLLRLPFYAMLLALLVVAAGLAVLHPVAIGGIVLRGRGPKASIEQGWRMLSGHRNESAVIATVLLGLGIVCNTLASFVLQPVAGVSLLSLLLAGGQGGFTTVIQGVGLLMLGFVATAIMAVAMVFGLVTLTLVYEAWDNA
jgi:hypothetical protein